MIPFLSFEHTNARIKEEILDYFENFFDQRQYILGPAVSSFENEYAAFNKVKHCIGLSNGLDALHISLKCLNIGKGDEVIIPSNTFIASALAVSYVGATPVFAEPSISSYNIDPERIEEVITSRTKAIMPVHLYGQACEMEKIVTLAKKHDLFIIEDNAQSQGASFQQQLTGSFGDISGTSFYPGKNIGALGDAGAITTNDTGLADKAKLLRNYGSGKKYHHDVIGFNMRMDECQAGFLSVKLKYLQEWIAQRLQVAEWYNEALKGISDLVLPAVAPGATHVYHLYVIRTGKRDGLHAFLNEKGIGTLIHYPVPPHLQKAYTDLGFKEGSYPIAEEIAQSCLSLPVWPGLKQSDIELVADTIRQFY